jgi:hypothetical protein
VKIFSNYINENFIQEGRQDYLNFLGKSNNEKYVKTDLEWAIKVLKKQDRIMWFLRFVKLADQLHRETPEHIADYKAEVEKIKKNPSKDFFTKRDKDGVSAENQYNTDYFNATGTTYNIKQKLEHFVGMEEQIPKIKGFVFKYQTPGEVFDAFEKAEEEYKSEVLDDASLIPDEPDGYEVIEEFPGDWYWLKLNRGYCEKEAEAMGHCGNIAGKQRTSDRILSLRKKITKGKETYWQPHLTFILMEGGMLGEMKGKANEKPAERYHKYIIPLLKKDDLIKGIVPNFGYLPSSNFKLSDLDEKSFNELVELNPNLASIAELVKVKGKNDPSVMKRAEDYMQQLASRNAKNIKDPTFIVLDMTKNFNHIAAHNYFPKITELLRSLIDGDYFDQIMGYEPNFYAPGNIEMIDQDSLDALAEYYGLDPDDFSQSDLVEKMQDDTDLREYLQPIIQDAYTNSYYDSARKAIYNYLASYFERDYSKDLPFSIAYKDEATGELEYLNDKSPNGLLFKDDAALYLVAPKGFRKNVDFLINNENAGESDLSQIDFPTATEFLTYGEPSFEFDFEPDFNYKELSRELNKGVERFLHDKEHEADPRQTALDFTKKESHQIKEADPKTDAKYRREAEQIWNKMFRKLKIVLQNPSLASALIRKELLDPKHPQIGYAYYFSLGLLLGDSKLTNIQLGIAPIGAANAGAWYRPGHGVANEEIVLFSLDPKNFSGSIKSDAKKILQDPMFKETAPYHAANFVHEFIHYLDSKRYKTKDYNLQGTQQKAEIDLKAYFNDPKEFNAHTQDFISLFDKFYREHYFYIARQFETGKRDGSKDNDLLEKTIDRVRLMQQPTGFYELWNHLLQAKTDFEKCLTDINRKKLRQRIYQYHQEILKPQLSKVEKSLMKTYKKLSGTVV